LAAWPDAWRGRVRALRFGLYCGLDGRTTRARDRRPAKKPGPFKVESSRSNQPRPIARKITRGVRAILELDFRCWSLIAVPVKFHSRLQRADAAGEGDPGTVELELAGDVDHEDCPIAVALKS